MPDIKKMFGKQAAWRRAANEIFWALTNPRVFRIRFESLRAYIGQWLADTSHLTPMTEAEFKASRKTDRVFIFGSGGSLNDITPEAWAHIAQFDTFGFSLFIYQDFVRTDYHLLREMYLSKELDKSFWLPYSEKFCHYLDTNPHFDKTIFIVQKGWRSLTVNRMLALGLLKKPRPILKYHIKAYGIDKPPSFSLEEGIVHGAGTLIDALNFAIIGGWKHIILAGVDLYDARYFWGDEHHNVETFGRSSAKPHNTVTIGIIDNIRLWRDILAERGMKLWVHNPKSLLTEVLPVYTPDAVSDDEV